MSKMSVLMGWGANSYGQLGVGRLCEQCQVPEEVQLPFQPNRVKEIAGGGGHSCILDTEGNLWTCGWNHKGQCGHKERVGPVFKKVTIGDSNGEVQIVGMACGWDWTMIWTDLATGGEVWASGSNAYGQLGLGMELKHIEQFVKVPGLESVTKIACGLRHSLVLDSFGQVRGLGNTKKKQLGGGKPEAVSVGNYTAVNLPDEQAVDIACGQYFSLVLTRGGKLFGFGDNKFGQIAPQTRGCENAVGVTLIPTPEPFVSLQTGWTHALGVTEKGDVYSWGRNNYGQLGRNSGDDQAAIGIVDDHLGQVKSVKSGSEHCVAVTKKTGELVSWGWNEHGNCGDGSTENIVNPSPIALPKFIVDNKYQVLKLNTSSAHNFALLTLDS